MVPFVFLILFTFSILYFSFGVYTLFKNIQSLKNRMFFSLCLHLSCWALGYAFMTIAPTRDLANFWRVISAFGWCFTYSVWLDFTILVKLESIKWLTSIKRLLIYIPAFYFFIVNLTYEPGRVIIKLNNIWKDVYPISFFEGLFIFYYVIFTITGMVIIYRWGKHSQSIMEKKQAKIIVAASALTFALAAFTDTILPLFGIEVFSYGIIAFSIALCGIWQAITKYKMLSITAKDAIDYILRTVADPVILIGNDLCVKEANNAALEMTGYKPLEIKGMPIKSFISDEEYNQESFQTLLRAGGITNIEIGLLSKSRYVIPCLLSGAVINNDLNEIIGIAYIFHNITDRKKNEEILIRANENLEAKVYERTSELEKINALLEIEIAERKRAEDGLKSSEEKYRSLMKQATDGILVFDPITLAVIESNEKGCNILEYSEVELSHLDIETLFSIDKNKLLYAIDDILNKRQAIVKETATINGRYGTTKMIEFSATSVMYHDKQFIMVTLMDITEKQIMEERKQQMAKMESLGTLAGGIAHDFNNILAGIIGYTQLSLEDSKAGFPIENYLSEVLKLGERAKKLIAQILTFSRRTLLEPRIVDMREIINEVINMLKTTTPATIEIKFNCEGYSANVFADPGEMQQLIMNLCINAELSMNDKGGILEVALSEITLVCGESIQYQALDEGKYIKVQVADNGCGMERSMVERIFEPFYTTRVAKGGTGLGLSVVHGIVNRHGGIVTVESEPDKGSTFTVLLPASTDSPTDEASDEKIINSSAAKILFVDDEEAIVATMEKLLQREGYIVTGVLSGKEALKLFMADKHSFDIVITDQAMPDISGDALIEALHQVRPDIPVILCSGYSHVVNDENTASAGRIEYLLKPISKLELVNAVESVLQSRDIAG